jgi:AcrR family transcriptional regulator
LARRVFSTDAILDAAREVVVDRGPRAATVEAIAKAAGVPVGSIYHRFSSIDELLARVWLRAVRASQQAALAVPAEAEDTLGDAEAVALAMYDHSLANPSDTLLLDALSRAELTAHASAELRRELESVNDEIERRMARFARSVLGRADARARNLVVLALVDLPHGFAHRELSSGRPTPARRERLPAAVRAVLEADPPPD